MKNFIVGNWKMNQTVSEIHTFFKILNENQKSIQGKTAWIAPQFIHFPMVKELTSPLGMKVGVQNCSAHEKGAFTGDVSPISLKDMECHFTIIGHSERRAIFKESDEIINKKNLLALKSGLTVIFCVGETLQEREANQANEVVKNQLIKGLQGISPNEIKNLLVAYEPVWAIGTGKTATPQQAQEMHNFARKVLTELSYNAAEIPLLYGGSVTPANVVELLSQKDINGALVGGASLKAHDFIKLCEAS